MKAEGQVQAAEGHGRAIWRNRMGKGHRVRIDAEPQATTRELLEAAVARAAARPSAFPAPELSRFESGAASAIAELLARQARTRSPMGSAR
jgi:hypothetical protein